MFMLTERFDDLILASCVHKVTLELLFRDRTHWLYNYIIIYVDLSPRDIVYNFFLVRIKIWVLTISRLHYGMTSFLQHLNNRTISAFSHIKCQNSPPWLILLRLWRQITAVKLKF